MTRLMALYFIVPGRWRPAHPIIAAFIFYAAFAGGYVIADGNDAVGEWLAPKDMRIQLYWCRDYLCGRIVKIPDPERKDMNNAQPRLRTRMLVGAPVLSMARPISGGWKGELYDPDSGQMSNVRLVPDGRAILQVTACGMLGIICHTTLWSRVR